MASAMVREEGEDENRPRPSKLEDGSSFKLDELKSKAFIAPTLPEDFLRIVLDQRQIAESKDNQLAKQLQYGMNAVNYANPNMYGFREIVDYGRGKLQVDINEAKLNKNYGLTRMDPYVRLKIGPRMFETPTAYNGSKNPVWHKTIVSYLPKNVDSLVIEIYDEKSFTEDELIAFVKFPFPKSLFDGIFLDEWIPLNGKLGEQKEGYINIQMMFTPLENLQAQPNLPVRNTRLEQKSSLTSTSPSSSASSNISDNTNENNVIAQPGLVQLPPEDRSGSTEAQDLIVSPANIQLQTNTNTSRTNAGPSYTEEDLNSIKDMFPTFDIDVIKSLLDLNNGNKEAAIEALLQMN